MTTQGAKGRRRGVVIVVGRWEGGVIVVGCWEGGVIVAGGLYCCV